MPEQPTTAPTPKPETKGTAEKPELSDAEIVEKRMKALLSNNNPLMQQAQADAMKAAAQRGLLNTSIAASAGVDAMIRNAFDISKFDAAGYRDVAIRNMAAQNQFKMQEYLTKNQFTLTAYGYKVSTYNNALQNAYNSSQSALNRKFQAEQSHLARELNKMLAEMGFDRADEQGRDACTIRGLESYNAAVQALDALRPDISEEEYNRRLANLKAGRDAVMNACNNYG